LRQRLRLRRYVRPHVKIPIRVQQA
jgi:hypothetical protein